MRKNAHRIQASRFGRFLRFADRRNTGKPDRFEKTRYEPFYGGKCGGPKVEVGKIDLLIKVLGLENPTVVIVRR